MSNSFKENHIAPMHYDKMGRPTYEAPLTPKADTKRYICVVPPEKVIPVIFVPGIMGSNLKVIKPIFIDSTNKKIVSGTAWLPDSKYFLIGYGALMPSTRRHLLDPKNTEVAPLSDIADCDMSVFKNETKETQQNWMGEFKRRGWCTVMLSSYGAMLCHLECYLNRIYYHGEPNPYWHNQIKDRVSLDHTGTRKELDWGKITGFTPLDDAQLKHASNFWYPVHAVGYNWLQSNKEGGKYLANKIDEIIDHYNNKLGFYCEKVILVTHSMGGLVARAACHPQMGKKGDKVLGIVHGVMPANGAGTAYKRQHAGFEGGASAVLGLNGAEVAAVFSKSPGALQLLPNKRYGTGWLKVVDSTNKEMLALPKADPYAEIYREQNRWWRLMNPAWLDSAPNTTPTKRVLAQTWKDYIDNLSLAESFHDTLADYYHPQSYVHFGADKAQASWGNVTWQEMTRDFSVIGGTQKSAMIADGVINHASGLGHVRIHPKNTNEQTMNVRNKNGQIQTEAIMWRGEIGVAKEAGDGTVPEMSATPPANKVVLCAAMKGFDHQGSYQNSSVQELALYCIARIAQGAK